MKEFYGLSDEVSVENFFVRNDLAAQVWVEREIREDYVLHKECVTFFFLIIFKNLLYYYLMHMEIKGEWKGIS